MWTISPAASWNSLVQCSTEDREQQRGKHKRRNFLLQLTYLCLSHINSKCSPYTARHPGISKYHRESIPSAKILAEKAEFNLVPNGMAGGMCTHQITLYGAEVTTLRHFRNRDCRRGKLVSSSLGVPKWVNVPHERSYWKKPKRGAKVYKPIK